MLKGTKRFEIWNKTVFFLQQWEFETMYEISLPGSCNSNWEIIEANEIRFEELLSLVIIMQKSLSKIYIHFKSLQTSIKVHSTGLSYFRHYVENQRFLSLTKNFSLLTDFSPLFLLFWVWKGSNYKATKDSIFLNVLNAWANIQFPI